MEQMITAIITFLVSIADKYTWLSYTLMAIGGAYVVLSLLRGFLTGLVLLTKTDKDNKVVANLYAFLDKFAYGFGRLADYYETKVEEAKKEKKK